MRQTSKTDGLPISANGWQRSQIIQAMDTIHKLNNQLKSDSESSEDKLEEDNITSDTNESDTNSIIQNLIQKSKLGSTILISTDVFLQLISNQPCIICYDTNSSNQKFKIKTNGLGVQVDCITGAGLIGGVNREELCSILAFLGITKQNGHQQYYNKQEEYFENLYQAADLSANNTLREVCDYLQNKGQDLLEVSFDCTWSHVQASGEFIFNGELEGQTDAIVVKFAWNFSGKLRIIPVNW
ncbi:2000_t:CDS:2, partial [Rhizophagus irregularis]